MPTLRENVLTQLRQVAELIVQVTESPNPDYSVAGRSISKGAYLATLHQTQKELMTQLQAADIIDNGPWQVTSFGG